MAPQPVVTGLSPKEGPPGTRVIIRGEFLGTRAEDLIGEYLSINSIFKSIYPLQRTLACVIALQRAPRRRKCTVQSQF